MGFRCRPAHDSGCGGHPLLGGRQQAGWIEQVSSYPRVGSVNFVDAMFLDVHLTKLFFSAVSTLGLHVKCAKSKCTVFSK